MPFPCTLSYHRLTENGCLVKLRYELSVCLSNVNKASYSRPVGLENISPVTGDTALFFMKQFNSFTLRLNGEFRLHSLRINAFLCAILLSFSQSTSTIFDVLWTLTEESNFFSQLFYFFRQNRRPLAHFESLWLNPVENFSSVKEFRRKPFE